MYHFGSNDLLNAKPSISRLIEERDHPQAIRQVAYSLGNDLSSVTSMPLARRENLTLSTRADIR